MCQWEPESAFTAAQSCPRPTAPPDQWIFKACVCVGLGSFINAGGGREMNRLAVYTEPGPGRGEWQSSVCVCVCVCVTLRCLLFGLRDWSPASIYRSIIHPLLISPSSPDEKRTITRATGPQTHTQIHTKAKANRSVCGSYTVKCVSMFLFCLHTQTSQSTKIYSFFENCSKYSC